MYACVALAIDKGITVTIMWGCALHAKMRNALL
jgi:hypothetical protein